MTLKHHSILDFIILELYKWFSANKNATNFFIEICYRYLAMYFFKKLKTLKYNNFIFDVMNFFESKEIRVLHVVLNTSIF